MARVSVIVPNFNYRRFLKERVRSILCQTYKDFEILYVDDGSSDGSNEVMTLFASDRRLRTRMCKENSGTVYRRWNEAAQDASGHWLWFANADDSAHPRFLERLMGLVDGNPRVAIAHSNVAIMNESGQLISDRFYSTEEVMAHLASDHVADGTQELLFLTGGLYLRTASAAIIRRDAFVDVGGFDTRLWGLADYDLYLKLLHAHDLAYAAEPLTYFRSHGLSTTSNTDHARNSLALAYAFASAYRRMQGDPRYTVEMRESVRRRARVQVFELFGDPSVTLPDGWQFAAKSVFEVIRDRRLISARFLGAASSQTVAAQTLHQ